MPSVQGWIDDIQALTDLVLEWQQEHENTGRWPIGEIAACLAFAAAIVSSLLWFATLSVNKHWPKWGWRNLLFVLGWTTCVMLAGSWMKKWIRSARRRRRRAARKAELMTGGR
ncbi:MAG TPA: hypothetical protein VD837_04015 [Terriglobales bacterium]|nr:hypothetical protein [Terriglobales bacterium]